MYKNKPFEVSRRTLLAAAAAGLGAEMAVAGGHTGGKRTKEPIQVDTTPRRDVTGTVLITGANRGIGLAMAQNYAERGWRVIATARSPNKATELNALAKSNDRVTVERLDLLDHGGIDELAKKLSGTPIDVLLNNAAILGEPNEQNFGSFDYDLMRRVFDTNVVGVNKTAEAFIGHVEQSDQKKLIAITSQQGSISSLRSPSIMFYNMSKTALNMSMRSNAMALKKRGITVALISPGAVETDMMNLALERAGVSFKLLTPEQSAEMVINVIDNVTPKITGTFLSHFGKQIPW